MIPNYKSRTLRSFFIKINRHQIYFTFRFKFYWMYVENVT